MECCSCIHCPPIFEKMDRKIVAAAGLCAVIMAVAIALLFTPVVATAMALTTVAAVAAVGAILTISILVWGMFRAQNRFIGDVQAANQITEGVRDDLLKSRVSALKALVDKGNIIQKHSITSSFESLVLKIAEGSQKLGEDSLLAQIDDEAWGNVQEGIYTLLEKERITEKDLTEDDLGDTFMQVWNQVKGRDVENAVAFDPNSTDTDD
jgi:hypothetical protein